MAELKKLGEMCVGMVLDASKPVEDSSRKFQIAVFMSRPLKLQIVERAPELIADEQFGVVVTLART